MPPSRVLPALPIMLKREYFLSNGERWLITKMFAFQLIRRRGSRKGPVKNVFHKISKNSQEDSPYGTLF